MLADQDRLAFCTALQRLSRFTPAELALTAGLKLRQAQAFLQEHPSLVSVQLPRGHHPGRPLREYWTVIGDRVLLLREIERLRTEQQALPRVGELFNSIDRLLHDVARSERALANGIEGEEARHIERSHLSAQRLGIDHALLDLEISVSRAVRARRLANERADARLRYSGHRAAKAWAQRWFERPNSPLVDWSIACEGLLANAQHSPLAAEGTWVERLGNEVARLAASREIDESALCRSVSALRQLRSDGQAAERFGEVLDEEFRHVLRQPSGGRLLGPLAVVATALAETACAGSLFEGWILTAAESLDVDDPFPLVPAVLARLAFETHHHVGKRWTENRPASMCQYALSTSLAPLGVVLAASGALLGEAPNVHAMFSAIASSHGELPAAMAGRARAAIARTLGLVLFLQKNRRTPLRSIPSLPELPGGQALFEALMDHDHGAVVPRLERVATAKGRLRGERYQLRPGQRIKDLLHPDPDEDLTLAMRVTHEFAREQAESSSSMRWERTAAPATSFLGQVEMARAH